MTEQEMHEVIIALGTNTDHKPNMDKAVCMLGDIITGMRQSRRLWTTPIDMACDMFMNMIVSGSCALELEDLYSAIKNIEKKCGRNHDDKKKHIVKIDIDILKYDKRKEHPADWEREYIKTLIKEI